MTQKARKRLKWKLKRPKDDLKKDKKEKKEKKWLKRLIENEERLKGDSKETQKRLKRDTKETQKRLNWDSIETLNRLIRLKTESNVNQKKLK